MEFFLLLKLANQKSHIRVYLFVNLEYKTNN